MPVGGDRRPRVPHRPARPLPDVAGSADLGLERRCPRPLTAPTPASRTHPSRDRQPGGRGARGGPNPPPPATGARRPLPGFPRVFHVSASLILSSPPRDRAAMGFYSPRRTNGAGTGPASPVPLTNKTPGSLPVLCPQQTWRQEGGSLPSCAPNKRGPTVPSGGSPAEPLAGQDPSSWFPCGLGKSNYRYRGSCP